MMSNCYMGLSKRKVIYTEEQKEIIKRAKKDADDSFKAILPKLRKALLF